jgi:adenosylhomocysteinase
MISSSINRDDERRMRRHLHLVSDRFISRLAVRPRLALVQQDMPDVEFFVDELSRWFPIEYIVRKPYGIETDSFRYLSRKHNVVSLTWDDIDKGGLTALTHATLQRSQEPLVVIEIGGYHAPALHDPNFDPHDRLLGVIEMTQAGVNAHLNECAQHGTPSTPVFETVSGPAKVAETEIVGRIIADAISKLDFPNCTPVSSMKVGVLGFGRIGQAVAARMTEHGATVLVHDIDFHQQSAADAAGHSNVGLTTLLQTSDLIIECTGATTLTLNALKQVKPGAVIANAGSHGHGIDLPTLDTASDSGPVVAASFLSRYMLDGTPIFVVADGQPINHVLHRPVGPLIAPLQAEVIASIAQLAPGRALPGINALSLETRNLISSMWHTETALVSA